jgi:hypothetical protein
VPSSVETYRALDAAHRTIYRCAVDIDDPRAGLVSDLVLGRRAPTGARERAAIEAYRRKLEGPPVNTPGMGPGGRAAV